jgi:DNA invertase Pin-like site-specific DNA recombinase
LTLIYQHLGLLFDSSVESKESAVGERIGYQRVSTVDQNTDRQLDGVAIDKLFTDKASGKDTNRPELARALDYVRDGDTLVVHSMDRLARNLEDLRRLVRELTGKGIRVEFVKESLTFAGDDSPMNTLLLSMLGAVAEFERSMILERQREGIALAKAKGVYRGREVCLTDAEADQLRDDLAAGGKPAELARRYGISRASVYNYRRPDYQQQRTIEAGKRRPAKAAGTAGGRG